MDTRLPNVSGKVPRKGFTLIELLVVIGILATLLAIVLIAINPARQFSKANNTQRRSDVLAVLNAVHQYAADNKGTLPSGITGSTQNISNTTTGAAFCNALVPTYIAALPFDPTAAGAHFTSCADHNLGYSIATVSGNRVTVSAPTAELSETISVTR